MLQIIRLLVLFFIMILVSTQCDKNPSPNNTVYIPDTAFLEALIVAGIDINADGMISNKEAEAVYNLDVSGNISGAVYGYRCDGTIQSLQGIEAFINLDTLKCYCNHLDSLDLSKNRSLDFLDCRLNPLVELNIGECQELKSLYCFSCNLKKLNISNNGDLRFIDYSDNPLTSINLSNNPNLITLRGYDTQINSLDLSNNLELKEVLCWDGQLSDLNFGQNNSIWHIELGGNNITQMDLSNCTSVEIVNFFNNPLLDIDVSSNLSLRSLALAETKINYLDISNNLSLKYLAIQNVPTLQEVCVWTLPFPPDSLNIIMENSPNVYFTTECNQ